jgi:putative ABC transport system ATP-binding protein
MHAVVAHDLKVAYPDKLVYNLVVPALIIPMQGLTCILGENGAGKSTLAELIALNLWMPYEGSLKVLGVEVRQVWGRFRTQARMSLHRRIGFVPQDGGLNKQQRVWDALVQALDDVLVPRHEQRTRIARALSQMDLVDYTDHYIYELSGGEVQRLAIARALSREVEFVVADEPTSALDDQSVEGLMQALQRLSERLPVVVVTHDVRLVEDSEWSKNAVLIEKPGMDVRRRTKRTAFRPALAGVGLAASVAGGLAGYNLEYRHGVFPPWMSAQHSGSVADTIGGARATTSLTKVARGTALVRSVTLRWHAGNPDIRYGIQVLGVNGGRPSNAALRHAVVHRLRAGEHAYDVRRVTRRILLWRVTEYRGGRRIVRSRWFTYRVMPDRALAAIPLFPRDGARVRGRRVHLRWSRSRGARGYLVVLDHRRPLVVHGQSIEWVGSFGLHTWQVAPIEPSVPQARAQYSSPVRFALVQPHASQLQATSTTSGKHGGTGSPRGPHAIQKARSRALVPTVGTTSNHSGTARDRGSSGHNSSVYVAPTQISVYVAPTQISVYVAPTQVPVYVAPTQVPAHTAPTQSRSSTSARSGFSCSPEDPCP